MERRTRKTIQDAERITEYIVEEGLEEIPRNAFLGSENLTKVVMVRGVKKIGTNCFYGCKNLTMVMMVPGIRRIGLGAFSGCEKLSTICLKEGLDAIGDGAFSYSGLERLKLVEGIRTIGHDAFYWCENLTHVEINEGVEKIGSGVFAFCSKLQTISFPLHEIKTFDRDAFVSKTNAGWRSTTPPLETLQLRRPASTPSMVSIPFPWKLENCKNDDMGRIVRFIGMKQEHHILHEFRIVNTYFFVCFAMKCSQTGLYNAYGGPVLAHVFRFLFRGASLPFPIRLHAHFHGCALSVVQRTRQVPADLQTWRGY